MLDLLKPTSESTGVQLALENLGYKSWDSLERVFENYPDTYIGLCYDSGHANIRADDGLEKLEKFKHRLISLHLHDNDGEEDQHRLLFSGSVDWEGLAPILATSSYQKLISMEVVIGQSGIEDEKEFLKQAFQTGNTFSEMVENSR